MTNEIKVTPTTPGTGVDKGNKDVSIHLSDFIRGIDQNVDLSVKDASETAKTVLIPLFTAAKEALKTSFEIRGRRRE